MYRLVATNDGYDDGYDDGDDVGHAGVIVDVLGAVLANVLDVRRRTVGEENASTPEALGPHATAVKTIATANDSVENLIVVVVRMLNGVYRFPFFLRFRSVIDR